jgi:uncharacterized coiled-coil protein SlyX
MEAEARIAELEGLVAQQDTQLEAALAQKRELVARVQELEARVAKTATTAISHHRAVHWAGSIRAQPTPVSARPRALAAQRAAMRLRLVGEESPG